MSSESCCTCAILLSPPSYNFSDEQKQTDNTPPRRLPCCQRSICADCISKNLRFATYCPFCQVSTVPTSLPQGLRDPPAYSPPASPKHHALSDTHDVPTLNEELPSYADASAASRSESREDVIHHVHPTDTMTSLSLAYKVPAPILRQHNSLFQDSMLPARRTISIPASHYSGPSLSDKPVESEVEIERKARIRRFMMQSKCHEYSIAELYLGSAGGNVEVAVEKWWADEKWERENPIKEKGKGKGKQMGYLSGGGGLTGQLR